MIKFKDIIRLLVILFLSITGKIQANATTQGYDITVEIKNFPDTVGYLGYHFGDQKFVKDTSRVLKNNVLHFQGSEDLNPGIYFVYSPSVYFEIIINEQKFSIKTDTVNMMNHMEITGSKENQVFHDFQQFMAEKQKLLKELNETINTLDKTREAARIEELKKQLTETGKEIEAYQANVINNNPGTFVAKLLMAMKKPQVPDPPKDEKGGIPDQTFQFYYYKNHFFDHFDLSDPALLRTPLYQPKVEEYTEKLTYQHPDSINKAMDFLLTEAGGNEETFRYMLVKLTNKYETSNIMGMERVFVYLAENYYLKGKAFWADPDLVEKFEKRVNELKPNLVGNTAPEMILRDTLMKPVRLSAIDSRFIILYFYDPDCGHCKKTTPKLRNSYERFKQKDVEVLAACTETDIEKWKKYIREYQLVWINAADPNLQSNFRAEYDIKSTPIIYVLNRKKEIIAKRIGVEQLEDFINRMIEIEEKDS
ncbi:MAG: redoxin domain-containing protein [Cyclobacteriaceae bacterium]|nr:redoxin domain-containing protein [Cyclobacteriaceae bacterium]